MKLDYVGRSMWTNSLFYAYLIRVKYLDQINLIGLEI